MHRAALRLSLAVVTAIASAAVAAPLAGAAPAAPSTPDNSWLPPTPYAWGQVVDSASTAPVTVTRGITEHADTVDTVAGRQRTQVLEVNLADPNVRTGVVEAGDLLTDPADETVGSMGTRTGAIAGVNGDYFDINASGRPLGGVIANGVLLKSPRPNYNAQLGVRADGSMVIGAQAYTGTLTDGPLTHAVTSLNVVDDIPAGGITHVTPALGTTAVTGPATLVLGHRSGPNLVVDSVQTALTAVPALTAPQEGLLGGGAGGAWLAANVHPGDTVTVTEGIGPDSGLTQLLSGATQLVKAGRPYTDPTGTPPGGVNPETAVGLTKDGEHAIVVTIDGRLGESAATGVSPNQAAGYLISQGAYTGILFDGGGSTEMDTRLPGAAGLSVRNTPSDGTSRPVSNGLYFYTTAKAAGPARTVAINNGTPVTTVPGAVIDVPVTAVDALANPATGHTGVQVLPPGLADWSDGKLTVHHAGLGVIVARNGTAVSTQPLRVVDRLSALSASPTEPDLVNGAAQQFSLTGSTAPGQAASVLNAQHQPTPVVIPSGAATWSVSDPSLGSVSAGGLFTASASGSGLVTVTATVGGKSSSAGVAIGSTPVVADTLSSVANWSLRNTTGDPATLTVDPGSLPPGITAPGSLELSYTMPAGAGVKQLVLSHGSSIKIGNDSTGRSPNGVGLWIKGDGNGLTLHEEYLQVNGTALALAETPVTWQGWNFYQAAIPAGVKFPMTLDYIDFLAVSPPTTSTGTLEVSGLSALYSPRPLPTEPPYVPVPAGNPSWLQYSATPQPGSLLVGGGASVGAAGSSGAAVLAALPQVPAQFLGDMSASGSTADLATAESAMTAPFHDAVGPTETSAGALPENGDFAATFGATHYAYTQGSAQVIVTDSAHGGLLASDQFNSPAEAQYPWLVSQLSANRQPVVLLATNLPVSGFADPWEAQMYTRLAQRYQQTHPGKHVLLLSAGGPAYSETLLSTGPAIPEISVGDLGEPTSVPVARGGYPAYALLTATPAGTLRYTVNPVLTSLSITAGPVAVGTAETPAVADTPAVPMADPVAHSWASANPSIATINPLTGAITARRPGTTTITLKTAGQSAGTVLTVTA